MPHPLWYVYVIYSVTTGRLHVGITNDPRKRLKSHNAGKDEATKPSRPWVLSYVKGFESKGDAMKAEVLIRKMKRKDKLLLTGLAA